MDRGEAVIDKELLREITYTLLQLVPLGRVVSYKELADIIGVHPRVIARFMALNDKPLIIPCHRVVGSKGELRGYSRGGPGIKEKLLKLEGVEVIDGRVPEKYFYPLKNILLDP